MTLNDLYTRIKFAWRFDSKKYPVLRHFAGVPLPDGDYFIQLFALGHIQGTQQTELGTIASIMSRANHGECTEDPRELLKKPIGDMLINTLRMAAVAGISAIELEEHVVEWEQKQSKKDAPAPCYGSKAKF